MEQTLLNNATIIPVSAGVEHFTGSILIEKDTIKGIFKDDEELPQLPEEQTHDLTGKALLPGFINGHLHSDFTLFKGLLDDRQLIDQYIPSERLDALLTERDRLLIRKATYLEAVKTGTTFITDHVFTNPDANPVEPFTTVGVSGGLTLTDEDADRVRIEQLKGEGIKPYLHLPSEEEWCEDIFEKHRVKGIELDLPTYIHLAETVWRHHIVSRKFGSSPVQVLHRHDLLDERLVGVHCVWMDEEDIRIYADSGAGVINTPVSEMKIADGIAPIPQLLRVGVNIGLGTDGALWNNSCDMIGEAKTLLLLHSLIERPGAITSGDVLRMMTIDGARALGVDGEVGSIEVGKRADFVVMKLNSINLQPIYKSELGSLSSNIVNCGGVENIASVWCGGREVVRDGKHLTLDEDDIIGEMRELARRLEVRIKDVLL